MRFFQWDNADHFDSGIDSFDFQAVLYDSGNILMLYPEGTGATPTNPPFNPEHGSGSTTGLENATATDSIQFACDTNNSIPANTAVLFTYPLPRATPNVTESVLGAITIPSPPLLPGTGFSVTRKATINADTTSTATYNGILASLILNVTATATVRVDGDGDGVANAVDNCPTVSNADQADGNADGVGNVCDNCVSVANANQADGDADGVGDACDNCPTVSNAEQANADGDAAGDACDGCTTDAAKIAPGACGCGAADTDANGNGTPDCLDPPNPCGVCGVGGGFATALCLPVLSLARRRMSRRQRSRG